MDKNMDKKEVFVERAALEADEELYQRMLNAFMQSTQYELDFFEEAMNCNCSTL